MKLNRGLKDSNYDQLYAYLKHYEAHANENKMMLDRFTQNTVDPLTLMSNVSHQQYYLQSSTTSPSTVNYLEVRGKLHEVQVQLVIGELITELEMQIQVKQGRLSAKTATTMFMANLSSADPVYDEVGPSYDSDILSEVHDHDHYQDAVCKYHEVHEMHDDVQPNYFDDSHADYMSDSNTILYDQYVKDNAVPIVQSNVSSVPNDAYIMILHDMHEQSAQRVSVTTWNNVVDKLLVAKLATYKEQVELYERQAKFALTEKEQKIDEQLRIVITDRNIKEENLKKELQSQDQPALYSGHEIIKTNHVPTIVHNSEETLEIAEITRKKINDKMKDPECVQIRVKKGPHDYSKLEAEVDQNIIHRKHAEIERKNLLIANDNLFADCLSKDVFYTATNIVSRFSDMHEALNATQKRIAKLEFENSNLQNKIQNDDHDVMVQSRGNTIRELREKISRLTMKHSEAVPIHDRTTSDSQTKELHAKINALYDLNERWRAENEKVKRHYKELYDSIKITRAKNIETTNSLLIEVSNLEAQITENHKLNCITMPAVKSKLLATGRYDIDVEPIPPCIRNNKEVHLDYLKHLKENVETLREIVKEAKVARPLNRSLAYACLYTKHSQELLEYVIGTCLKDFNQRYKKHAIVPVTKKKQVTFMDPCETSTNNTLTHIKQQTMHQTNEPAIPST
uniref:Integrase, catalytic region, zinc finger, CCHC-type, peptidase aspartic, catalytic n=1 Tax=Tanacetum cinerariifolium TaxID=118510 RepID=A0A6L2NRK1_TANCI|nr:hypothetical protein [Tanacetum cinerariifolium]